MSDAISTPLGEIPKKWAIGGAAVAVIGVAMYYRHYQASKAQTAAASAGANTEIDPATGYAYGSAEDAAALGAQQSYINPAGGGGGGGTVAGTPSGGTGLPAAFGSNPAWVQYVLGYLRDNAQTEDNGATMQAALAVYITGGVPTPDQTGLINQAIAIAGYPPIAGANGYPPHINTQNPGGGVPTGHSFVFKINEDANTANAANLYVGVPGSGYYWAPSVPLLQSYLNREHPIDLGSISQADAVSRFGSKKPWTTLP
jgi:hypothetical protein